MLAKVEAKNVLTYKKILKHKVVRKDFKQNSDDNVHKFHNYKAFGAILSPLKKIHTKCEFFCKI
jgi:hypothetical protein